MLKFLKGKKYEAQGRQLFEAALQQAKLHGAAFYTNDKPTDDEDLRRQRFEVISLFMCSLLWSLKKDKENEKVAQAAYDTMFLSFDTSMRQGGVGDIGVSHKIKKFAQAFHGRIESYGTALDAGDAKQLCKAFVNNMKLSPKQLEPIAMAAFGWATAIDQKPVAEIVTKAS